MYPYITCFCGRSLGDLFDAFKAMRAIKYAEANVSTDPSMTPICEPIGIDLVDVFEQLNINLVCCRTRLTTQVEFKDVY